MGQKPDQQRGATTADAVRPGSLADPDAVKLTLDAVPENAATARHAIADAAARAGLDRETVATAKLVVSEAFTNAAAHAYPDDVHGMVEVAAYAQSEGITVVVRDRGEGLRPRPASERPTERLGLVMIASLATSTRLRRLPGGGTELRADIFPAPSAA